MNNRPPDDSDQSEEIEASTLALMITTFVAPTLLLIAAIVENEYRDQHKKSEQPAATVPDESKPTLPPEKVIGQSY